MSQYWALLVLFLGTAPVTMSQQLGLVDTLVASGASKFASFIQSDPDVLQLYTSGQFGTIFAPSDSVLTNVTVLSRALNPLQQRQAAFQAAKGETDLEQASEPLTGAILETAMGSPLLDGGNQRIVVDTRPINATGPTRRWHSPLPTRRAPASLLRITSGLGSNTNVIKGDIPFQGGIIHITDSYFTLPESLSSTSSATGQSTFSRMLATSNMTQTLESTHSITAFLPSDAAFSASNSTLPASTLLANHVVLGNVKYLPDLQNGVSLTTQRGERLAITVRGGQYYVNGARITKANLILDNGVAHVVDKIITPSPLSPPSPSAASDNAAHLGKIFAMVTALVTFVWI
ncbi:hypothetical protein EKO27_g3488 [Xylaria grammica]|uniref:FAS1 domain-containing protein n=1 Tax=Xylaria grammica TaxID=363999 RepID=A0A439DB21_9PEZI|nr:hypothetical protein EKO27_g3488 [Xylaria grammica]